MRLEKNRLGVNHLGNVLEVVTDRKLQIEDDLIPGDVAYYIADVVSQSDYYPFGMMMPNTNIDLLDGSVIEADNDYHYSFQGQEKDDEIKGDNNSINYKYRMHDPRVGRFFAVDPLAVDFPYNSPYNFSENRVIDGLELEGLEVIVINPTNSAGDARIVKGASTLTDKSAIHIVAHGGQTSFTDANSGKKVKNGSDFNSFLKREGYADVVDEAKKSVVVLHSCRTGRPIIDKNGKMQPSVAQKISLGTGNIVIAPDERDFMSENGEVGPHVALYTEPLNGNYLPGTARSDYGKNSGVNGNWMVYNEGVLVAVMDGDWKPTANVSGNDLTHMKKLTYTVTAKNLNFRSGPGVEFSANEVKLQPGDNLVPTGNADNGWMEAYNEKGDKGWVKADNNYVEPKYEK